MDQNFWINRSLEKKKKTIKKNNREQSTRRKNKDSGGLQNSKELKLVSGRQTKPKPRSQKQTPVVGVVGSSRDKKKSSSKVNQIMDVAKPSDSSRSDRCIRLNVPKAVTIQAREIDDDEVNKLVAKFRDNREKEKLALKQVVENDLKTQLVLDRVKKKPYNVRYKKLVDKGEKKERQFPSNELREAEEVAVMDKTNRPLVLAQKSEPAIQPPVAKTCPKTPIREVEVPNVEELLKQPPDQVFTCTGLPFWMDPLEPTDDDLGDVEPACPVGSKALEMVNDKTLVLKKMPTTS